MSQAIACANSNIALIKYWGKRDEALILPHNGSLSLTLDGLYSTTRVSFEEDLKADHFELDGAIITGTPLTRVSDFLNCIRAMSGERRFARVQSTNHLPTAAGLASSASGFAALALAGTRAAGLNLEATDLSRLARLGSGSACRSIYGGFVEWRRGSEPDGRDSHGVPIVLEQAWDLRMLVCVLMSKPKGVSSRAGMARTVATSPYYAAWINEAQRDLEQARTAIAMHDFETLGQLTEHSALKMHATMLTAHPPFCYWLPSSVALMDRVRQLRADGLAAYFTLDAGPNVKVLTTGKDAATIAAALEQQAGVERVLMCAAGKGARLIDEEQQGAEAMP